MKAKCFILFILTTLLITGCTKSSNIQNSTDLDISLIEQSITQDDYMISYQEISITNNNIDTRTIQTVSKTLTINDVELGDEEGFVISNNNIGDTWDYTISGDDSEVIILVYYYDTNVESGDSVTVHLTLTDELGQSYSFDSVLTID